MRWPLLVLILLIAGPAEAQPATTAVQHSGRLHVIRGDPLAGPATARTHPVLIDDAGRWHRLHIEASLLDALGGASRLHQRRVTVTGRIPGAPRTRSEAAERPAIDVDAVQPLDAEGAAISAVSGAQPWVTILCRFADSPALTPQPLSYFEGLMSAVRPGLEHYWKELSYGRISLAGSRVVGWYTLPAPRSFYVYATGGDAVAHLDFQRTVEDCADAAAADITLSDFAGINLMFNDVLDCCAWGGGATLTRNGVARSYRVTWIPPWAYAHQYLVAHEMGHGFGLPHSSGPYANPYDSDWDPMSGGGACARPDPAVGCIGVHTITHHKDLLGWIAGSAKFTPEPGQNETIVLERLAKPGADAGYLMARVPIPGAPTRSYTVEARRFAGYDREVPSEAVLIHEVDTARGDRAAQVVDPDGNGNPNDTGAMWATGEGFSDPSNQISVFVDTSTSTGYQVTILTSGFRLAVTRTGTGAGSLTSVPDGIDCGPICARVYDAGAVVTLKAVSDATSAFAGWSGCDVMAGSDCTVVLSGNRSIGASFSRRPRLSVTISGDGAVRSVPGGIDCGTICAAAYTAGTTVTLSPSPGPYSAFAGWSGNSDCADGIVSLTADTACVATFRPVADLAMTFVSDPPATLRPGGRLVLTDTVLNRGLAAAGSFRVRYYLSRAAESGPRDTRLFGRRVVPGLPAGAASTGTTTVFVPFVIASGLYHVLACADDPSAVPESDEAGNCRTTTASVAISWRHP